MENYRVPLIPDAGYIYIIRCIIKFRVEYVIKICRNTKGIFIWGGTLLNIVFSSFKKDY